VVDGGYTGQPFADDAKERLEVTVQVVKRNELHTFAVLPKVWVVERSFGWLEKCRRLWKNCELKPPTQKIVNRHYSTFTASSPFSRNR
jgi:transposase